MGAVCTALYLAAVVLLAGRATGALWPVRAAATADRGWFPGGEEDEPEPAPQPEQAHRPVPPWARP